MNVKEMKTDRTYLLCPDKNCKLLTKPDCWCPCERDCPHQDKLTKIIKCQCGEIIELPGNHSMMRRVDHDHPDGSTACTFVRMSGKYERIFAVVV